MGVGDPISLGITSSGRPPSQDFRFAILASIDYTSDAGCNLFHGNLSDPPIICYNSYR
jgi:hypothetical protein